MRRISASARVRCGGQMHTIEVTKKGALVLRDHPCLREELTLAALGGELPYCLQVLESWRQKDIEGVPRPLRDLLDAADTKACERQRKRASAVDLLTLPLLTRVARRSADVAWDVLASCAYRRAQECAGGEHYIDVNIDVPLIIGGAWPGRSSHISATVPRMWLIRVYKRGLAAVDGLFVLDILGENEDGIVALVGRQGEGFEVYPSIALIVRGDDGKYHIRQWLQPIRAIVGTRREKALSVRPEPYS